VPARMKLSVSSKCRSTANDFGREQPNQENKEIEVP
jgi:hypothetical protein